MRAALALALAVSAVAAGCLAPAPVETAGTISAAGTPVTPVAERASLPFRTDDTWSHVLEEGTFGILDALSVYVNVDVRVGEGLPTQQAHMGVFLPEIPGCDWEAAEIPASCRVPVIADVGPYYADGDLPATDPETRRLGGFLIENFVPHGYAVAQVSVLGTGLSGGCMDLMGEVEQAGVQAAVEWLGTQPWSNGAVGLIGRSYDGSTPWEAAMAGSEHLKTVVPISGLYGQHDLMWRNGSAELRGPGLLWALYYTFTYSPGEGTGPGLFGPLVPTADYAPGHAVRIAENAVCPDTQTGGAHAVQAYGTGDHGALAYWEERSFKDEVLANYEGSVYFIHGLQDWNVDPHMAFPFYGELQAKGLEIKGLFGQWHHHYPDRPDEHGNCDVCAFPTSVRWDWAQDLKEWFDHYLKGTGAKPQLHVEVQDDKGAWRIESTWPPADVAWTELALGADLAREGSGPAVVAPLNAPIALQRNSELIYTSEPLAADTRIAGLPQLHVTVTPAGPGGQLYAELVDATDGKKLGHAIMDLRFAAGNTKMQPVVPGMPLLAAMEFEPLDVLVPAGHVLELRIRSTGMDYMPAVTSAPVTVGDGVLRLPTIERGAEAFFTPPGGEMKVGEDKDDF